MNGRNKKNLLLLILAVLLIAFPFVMTNAYILLLVNMSLVYMVTVLGMNFVTGLTGQNNLGMAGIFALGAYTGAITTVNFGLPTVAGLVFSVIMGLILGQLLGRPTLRLKGVYFALTTQVLGECVRIFLNNAKFTNGTTGIRKIPSFSLFGFVFEGSKSVYYLYLFLAVVTILISMKLVHGRWGRELKAIRDNEEGVEACGVNMPNAKVKAFSLCTVIGCISGCMYSYLVGYINPTNFSYDLMVKFVMMLMLGGIGSVPGIVIGSFVIVMLPEMLRFLGDYYWLVFSIIMLVLIILRPYGLISIYDDLKLKLHYKKKAKQ